MLIGCTPTGRVGGITVGFKIWTDADRDLLGEMYMQSPRPPMSEIAAILGRSVAALQTEASRLDLPRTGVALRLCIPGQHQFGSTHNRICRRCTVDLELERA